jgi:hypothetical protein
VKKLIWATGIVCHNCVSNWLDKIFKCFFDILAGLDLQQVFDQFDENCMII